MDSQNLKFITWNVNGLKQNRDQKLQKLQNADVVFLQETHIGIGDERVIEDYTDEWIVFYTKYTSSSKGAAILVSKKLDFEYESDEKDYNGAYVVLKCKLAGQPYTLISVYNHQRDTKTLENLSRYLQSMTTGLLVIGGDFNTVLNKFIDKKWSTMTINNVHCKLLVFVEMFMKSLQLVDVWRRMNPVKQDFTYYVKDCPVSRLDYFFVPEECMWRVKSCEIQDSKISELKDHRPVSLEINNVSTMLFQKDPQVQSVPQWRIVKEDLLTDEMGLLLDAESSNAVSEVDIISAVKSLQVSDTPRPDGIPVSFYKDNIKDLIPYIKTLYDRICRGGFNYSQKYFNDTVKSDDSQHFFNVDYLVIASILAKRLDDFLQTLPKGRIPNKSAAVMMTPKTHYALLSLRHVKHELEQMKQKWSNPTLNQNLLIIENLLRDSNEDCLVKDYNLLHQSCPLSPGLIILALKSCASQLFGHLEKHRVFIFKQSVIICFQLKDLDMVKEILENTNELYEMEILSRENEEPLQFNCLQDYFMDEDSMESSEHFSKAVERDDGSEVCEENEEGSEICQEQKTMEVNIRASKEEDFHWIKNTPPLLPVPSQYRTVSDGPYSIHPTISKKGIKRKWDHESSGTSIESLLTTDEEIIEYARQIMKRVTGNPDPMDKDNRKKATIGIFGKSGVGKSSLLNAVFGKQNLLPSGCFGACTAVVTQVKANLTDSNYTAEIGFIDKEEWEKENLIREIENEDKDWNDELFEIAIEKITALYGADADKKTLEELKKDAKFAEIEYFLSSSKKIISDSDVSKFANDVARYIQHSESYPGGWYWPLVKSVTIKVPDCRELLEHIVLVDLPGTGDCNKIRDDLWKSKLSECSSVWIVSDINRASADKDSWGILKHCIDELGPGGECKNINFICTKTDDINTDAFIRSAQLHKDQFSVEKDLTKVCILQRNEQAKMKVKEKFYNSEIKKIISADDNFQVFTVSSNAFFNRNLNLEYNETEIPKLQEDLRSLNKTINRELTRDYVDKVKEELLLIQSDQLNKEKEMTETKVKVCIEFEKSLLKALDELDKYFHDIYNYLEQRLSKGVEESVQLCVVSTKALIAPKNPGNGFHNILSALCKNYGCYWSKNLNKVLDLNKKLAKYLQECIDEDFRQFFPVNTKKTGKSVQEQIEKFSIIQSDSGYPSFPIIQHICDYIKINETRLKASLSRDIIDRKKDIYSSIEKTIADEMSSCYEQAAAMKGPGSMKKKQDLLISMVDSIKQDMFRKSKMEVLKKLNNLKLHIMGTLEKEIRKAIEYSQSHTSKNTGTDVSREIEELERLSERLSN